ncbi:hypothetical protein CDAR_401001 [Caerostris darwini]|uniref:Uncharacterized protein n=1 Tax=Caerostris darwini TaxID=1538125 RepID=A0AAV4TH98_9ARAC|nr:hypothetical protein CDAR_401001 [Caerostris darwini]
MRESVFYEPLTRCISRVSVPRDGSEYIFCCKLQEAYKLYGVKRFHVNYNGMQKPSIRWNRICRHCPEYNGRA